MSRQGKWGGFAFLSVVALCFTVFFPIVAHATCPTDIVSYWTLDQTTGAPYLDSVDGNNGVVGAGRTAPSPATGEVNGAQLFSDATNTGISVPNPPSGGDPAKNFDWLADGSFSFELWMKFTGTLPPPDNVQVLLGRDSPDTGLQWWLGVEEQGQAIFFLDPDDATLPQTLTGGNIGDGNFHHVVGVRDAAADRILLYVDGVPVASLSNVFATNVFVGTAPVTIGYLNLTPFYHFDGIIDEVAIYNKALTQSEIQQHYNNGLQGKGYCAPPIPTGLVATAVSSSEIDLTWTASTDAASYTIYRDGTALPTSPTTNSFSDTGLTAATTYSYTVAAKDADGNVSGQSASASATTSSGAPSVPQGLVATAVSSSQINLTWTASTDAASYTIYRDGTQVGTSTTTSFSDTGLTASTTYSYTVAAVDAAGNESAQSASASATTASGG